MDQSVSETKDQKKKPLFTHRFKALICARRVKCCGCIHKIENGEMKIQKAKFNGWVGKWDWLNYHMQCIFASFHPKLKIVIHSVDDIEGFYDLDSKYQGYISALLKTYLPKYTSDKNTPGLAKETKQKKGESSTETEMPRKGSTKLKGRKKKADEEDRKAVESKQTAKKKVAPAKLKAEPVKKKTELVKKKAELVKKKAEPAKPAGKGKGKKVVAPEPAASQPKAAPKKARKRRIIESSDSETSSSEEEDKTHKLSTIKGKRTQTKVSVKKRSKVTSVKKGITNKSHISAKVKVIEVVQSSRQCKVYPKRERKANPPIYEPARVQSSSKSIKFKPEKIAKAIRSRTRKLSEKSKPSSPKGSLAIGKSTLKIIKGKTLTKSKFSAGQIKGNVAKCRAVENSRKVSTAKQVNTKSSRSQQKPKLASPRKLSRATETKISKSSDTTESAQSKVATPPSFNYGPLGAITFMPAGSLFGSGFPNNPFTLPNSTVGSVGPSLPSTPFIPVYFPLMSGSSPIIPPVIPAVPATVPPQASDTTKKVRRKAKSVKVPVSAPAAPILGGQPLGTTIPFPMMPHSYPPMSHPTMPAISSSIPPSGLFSSPFSNPVGSTSSLAGPILGGQTMGSQLPFSMMHPPISTSVQPLSLFSSTLSSPSVNTTKPAPKKSRKKGKAAASQSSLTSPFIGAQTLGSSMPFPTMSPISTSVQPLSLFSSTLSSPSVNTTKPAPKKGRKKGKAAASQSLLTSPFIGAQTLGSPMPFPTMPPIGTSVQPLSLFSSTLSSPSNNTTEPAPKKGRKKGKAAASQSSLATKPAPKKGKNKNKAVQLPSNIVLSPSSGTSNSTPKRGRKRKVTPNTQPTPGTSKRGPKKQGKKVKADSTTGVAVSAPGPIPLLPPSVQPLGLLSSPAPKPMMNLFHPASLPSANTSAIPLGPTALSSTNTSAIPLGPPVSAPLPVISASDLSLGTSGLLSSLNAPPSTMAPPVSLLPVTASGLTLVPPPTTVGFHNQVGNSLQVGTPIGPVGTTSTTTLSTLPTNTLAGLNNASAARFPMVNQGPVPMRGGLFGTGQVFNAPTTYGQTFGTTHGQGFGLGFGGLGMGGGLAPIPLPPPVGMPLLGPNATGAPISTAAASTSAQDDQSEESDGEEVIVAAPAKRAATGTKTTDKKVLSDDAKQNFRDLHANVQSGEKLTVADFNQFTVNELKLAIKLNDRSTTGNKTDLAKNLVDYMTNGCPPRCPECGGGRLKTRKQGDTSEYYCPGYMEDDEFVNCAYTVDVTTRVPWKSP